MRAGVLKSESANVESFKRFHLGATRIGWRGGFLVIYFSTNASTPFSFVPSAVSDTQNYTDPHVGVVVPAPPSTLAFLLLHSRCRCCAKSLMTNEAEDPGSIRALAIELDPSATVTFTLQVIKALVCWHSVPLHEFPPYFLHSQAYSVKQLASLCSKVWRCFVHFLHIGCAWHFSAMCPFLKQLMQRPSSRKTLILFANIDPLNTLHVCIWWPHILHARQVSSVDKMNNCLYWLYRYESSS